MSVSTPTVLSSALTPGPHDRNVIILHTTQKMVQAFALLSPPILLATAAYRRSFRLTPFLRQISIGTFILGPATGYGMGYAKCQGMDDAGAADRAYRIKMNPGQVRVDDWSVIGGVLGGIILPTILLKRAPTLYLVTGGAALGTAGGVLAHVVQNYKEGTETSVDMMVEEAKGFAKKS